MPRSWPPKGNIVTDSVKKTGLKTALRNLEADDRLRMETAALEDFDQLPLLPMVATEAPVSAADDAAVAGAGRPPGRRNRRTQEWTDYILSRYRSPLEVLAETYSTPTPTLSRRLRCSFKEAFTFQLQAARELAPYLHQKQPVAVTVDGKGMLQLMICATPEMAAMVNQATDDYAGALEIEVMANGEGASENV